MCTPISDWRKSRYVDGWKEPAYNMDWQDRGAEGSMWSGTEEPTCREGWCEDNVPRGGLLDRD